MKKNKKVVKIIVSIVCVLAVLSASLFAVNAVGSNKMFTHDGNVNVQIPDKYISLSDEALEQCASWNNLLLENVDEAVPVDEKFEPYIEKCNNAIIKYFKDKYNVDYTDRFNELEVMMYQFKVSNVMGYYTEAEYHNNIFLNVDWLETLPGTQPFDSSDETNSDEYFVPIFNALYMHEAVHYANDIKETDNIPGALCEGITDSLTSSISEYMGVEVIITTSYGAMTEYANQFIQNDEQLIPEMLKDGYDFVEYFDSRYGSKFFEQFDKLLYVSQLENGKYFDNNARFILQCYTIDYLKTVDNGFGKDDFDLKLVPAAGLRYLINN